MLNNEGQTEANNNCEDDDNVFDNIFDDIVEHDANGEKNMNSFCFLINWNLIFKVSSLYHTHKTDRNYKFFILP